MKVYKLFQKEEIHKLEFPMDSIVLSAQNGTQIVAMPFAFRKHNRGRLKIYVWDGCKWILTTAQNQYTDLMWNYQISDQRGKRKAEGKKYNGNYSAMMKHERVKKKGSGGEILRKFTGTVTDYECAKETLYDFRRSYNVLWN